MSVKLNDISFILSSVGVVPSILADYWIILVYGLPTWLAFQQPRGGGKYRGDDNIYDIPALYKKIITGRGS